MKLSIAYGAEKKKRLQNFIAYVDIPVNSVMEV